MSTEIGQVNGNRVRFGGGGGAGRRRGAGRNPPELLNYRIPCPVNTR